jgi:hypothetical protein
VEKNNEVKSGPKRRKKTRFFKSIAQLSGFLPDERN